MLKNSRPLYKLIVFASIFLLLFTKYSQAQNAGFTAQIGKYTYQVKNGDTLYACKNETIIYTYNNNTSVNWHYNNGADFNTAGRALLVTYNNTGNTFFTVEKINDQDAGIKVIVVVGVSNPLPPAHFTYTQTALKCGSDTVAFTANSAAAPMQYYWDFKDGGDTAGKNAKHVF